MAAKPIPEPGESYLPDKDTVVTVSGTPHDIVTVKFEVPSSSVGLIIGTAGKQVKKIQQEAQLKTFAIKISRPGTTPGVQTVSIRGERHNCEDAKRRIEELVEAGKSVSTGSKYKHLTFITFLKDSDEIVFNRYKGIPPSNWRKDDLYFLEACRKEASMPALEDLHHRLRNYPRLQESLRTSMEQCLGSAPTYLKLEARFGKVLWRSDVRNSVSDEVLRGNSKYKIEDLEKGGMMSVEDVLGRSGIKWDFQTILSDDTIPDRVRDAEFPVIGVACRIDITMHYCRGPVCQEYLIRIKQNKETFEVLGVHVTSNKPYIFDCLNLERDLDLRIAVSYSSHIYKPEAAAKMEKIAEELCHGMALREGCLYVKEPPGCCIDYARRGEYTMYLVSHHDKVHGECPYILADYRQVADCLYPEKSESAAGVKEVKLQLENEHHEVELWNCQWMVDFAVLVGQTPDEAFALKCCDLSKVKVRPKDKSEVTAASVIRELDPFVACALELALIDRD